jgi:hypothetical protein
MWGELDSNENHVHIPGEGWLSCDERDHIWIDDELTWYRIDRRGSEVYIYDRK